VEDISMLNNKTNYEPYLRVILNCQWRQKCKNLHVKIWHTNSDTRYFRG